MIKLNSAKVAEALADSANALRSVTAERDEAVAKLAQMQRRQTVEKLASTMQEKGLGDNREEIIEHLEKAASEGRIDTVRQAVDMVGSDMWSKIAQPTADRPAGGASDFERYLAGG